MKSEFTVQIEAVSDYSRKRCLFESMDILKGCLKRGQKLGKSYNAARASIAMIKRRIDKIP